jgi:hypothetical protein
MTREQVEELGRTAPIGRELAGKDICDGNWTRENASRFISHVEIRDRRWFLEDHWSDAGAQLAQAQPIEDVVMGLPETQVTCVITVTDPRWLDHLRPGMEWGSVAYDKDEKD